MTRLKKSVRTRVRGRMIDLTVVVRKETIKKNIWYTAWNPEFDVASQGEDIEKAVSNLVEAVKLNLSERPSIEFPTETPFVKTVHMEI